MRARSLLFVAGCLASAEDAHKLTPAKPLVIESVVKGADISKIIADLRTDGGAPERGEFETTTDFNVRIRSIPENLKKPLVFPVVLGEGTIRYDADKQRVLVDLPTHPHFSGQTMINTIGTRRVFTTQTNYLASNAFGVTKPVFHGTMEERGIAIQPVRLVGLSFEMDRARAEKVKPLLCLAVKSGTDRIDALANSSKGTDRSALDPRVETNKIGTLSRSLKTDCLAKRVHLC